MRASVRNGIEVAGSVAVAIRAARRENRGRSIRGTDWRTLPRPVGVNGRKEEGKKIKKKKKKKKKKKPQEKQERKKREKRARIHLYLG